MRKWEYRKFHIGDMSQPTIIGVTLDEIGEQGWELVCSSGGWLFFKRPVERTVHYHPRPWGEWLSCSFTGETARDILDSHGRLIDPDKVYRLVEVGEKSAQRAVDDNESGGSEQGTSNDMGL